MILVLTRSTVAAPRALDIKTVPKRFMTLGRMLYPRGIFTGLFWRTVFEVPVARYAIALSPFPIALIFKPEWALPISLAPVPMALFVMMLEGYLLSVPNPSARRALVARDEADRGMDLLKTRAMAALTRLGAGRDPGAGRLHLVIEQSGLLRVPPLTHVSLQQERPGPAIIDLTLEEQAMLTETLFDDAFDERRLLRINVAQDQLIRTFTLDPKAISAHARLAALAKPTG